MRILNSAWEWLIAYTPSPGRSSYVAFFGGFVITFYAPIWRRFGLLSVWAHEAGHAWAALITGGGVKSISLNKHSGGRTDFLTGPGRILQSFIAAAGYPAPAFFGSLLFLLMNKGLVNLAAGSLIAVAALFLPVQRSGRALKALLIIAAIGASALLVKWVLITIFAGYLCAGAIRGILELRQYRLLGTGDENDKSDARALSELLWLPEIVWEWLFLCLVLIFISLAFEPWKLLALGGR